ncbi:MAG TPA: nucleotide sugar dehydrogenase [Syntrophomonadaceae bacterium]|nr:nucleotide sugar dehydrogenase [Syntrophomonadaceae bacterium]
MGSICVIGLGYIGLPTAVVLSLHGYSVIGIDRNDQVLHELSLGKTHIKEPSLERAIKKAITHGNLHLASMPKPADAFVISVPTPNKIDKSCDLSFVLQAVTGILPFLSENNLIVIESTVPPMTCEEVIKPLIEKTGLQVGKDVFLAHCPERVMPGQIMREISENDRIIGGYSKECARRAAAIYSTFTTGQIILTNLRSAEMTKLMENTFRDVNIALANEMAQICNRLGINVLKAIEMANKHPRVDFLWPGPGVGGHCLAVDPYFIIEKTPDLAVLIAQARKINCGMPEYIVKKARCLLAGIESPKICVFGVSYKGNVEDTRESPALAIIQLLKSEGFLLSIYDPCVTMDELEKELDQAVKGADMILILTDHSVFKTLDYSRMAKEMRTPIVFDTRSIVEGDNAWSNFFSLYNLGNIFD